MTAPDPKPAARIVDRKATTRKLLEDRTCRACGRPASSGHHLLPKGERGDDVVDNVIPLCGDGASGCHGALHGNPYTVDRRPSFPCECGVMPVRDGNFYVCMNEGCDGCGQVCSYAVERRDGLWVRRKIWSRLTPQERGYLNGKLGVEAAGEYLRRAYYSDAA